MDKNKFDYMPMGKPNVLMEYPKGSTPPTDAYVAEFMAPLVHRLALRHPKWTLVGGGRDVAYFRIYEGTTLLGTLSRAYRDFSPTYRIDNHRLKADRRRGDATYTKDIKKALSIIAKNFGGLTLDEQFAQALGGLAAATNNARSRTSDAWHPKRVEVEQFALKYVKAHLEDLRGEALHAGVSADTLDTFEETRKVYCEADALNTAVVRGEGVYVLLQGENYFLKNKKEILTRTTDTIPYWLKANLAKLKIISNNEVLTTVGVRYNAATFFLLIPEGESL